MAAHFVDAKNRQLDRASVVQLAIKNLCNWEGMHYEHAEAKAENMDEQELMSWATDDDGNFPDDLVRVDGPFPE